MWLLPSTRSGSLADFIVASKSMCEWNKRHSDQAHTLPWMTQSMTSGHATCTHSYLKTDEWGTRSVQLNDCSSSVDSILHYTFAHLERNLWPSPSGFWFIPKCLPLVVDLLGGHHLISLSEELGSLGPAVFQISLMRETETGSQGEGQTPRAISFFVRLIGWNFKCSLTLSSIGWHQDHRKPGILIGQMPETPVLAVWNTIQGLHSAGNVFLHDTSLWFSKA